MGLDRVASRLPVPLLILRGRQRGGDSGAPLINIFLTARNIFVKGPPRLQVSKKKREKRSLGNSVVFGLLDVSRGQLTVIIVHA